MAHDIWTTAVNKQQSALYSAQQATQNGAQQATQNAKLHIAYIQNLADNSVQYKVVGEIKLIIPIYSDVLVLWLLVWYD